MTLPIPLLPSELYRIPGLFRRWELAEVLEPGNDYHLEDAGTTSDGTPLIAVYRSVTTDDDSLATDPSEETAA